MLQSLFNSNNSKSSDSVKNKLLNKRLNEQQEKFKELDELKKAEEEQGAVELNSRKDRKTKQQGSFLKNMKDDDNEDLEANYQKKLEAENLDDEMDVEEEDEGSENASEEARVLKPKVNLREEELEKASKTVFIGNLPQSVLTDKKVYKTFLKLFSTPLSSNEVDVAAEEEKNYKIKSCRFRSIAFSEPLPKAVAFKQLKLDPKRDSINCYLVYENFERKTISKVIAHFNSYVFEGHHLRVDSVMNPAKQDVARSVFVGNLDFEELEENLYQHFQQLAVTSPDEKLIEYVRIVRDPKTQMGKGFAYVQFYDSSYVNKAIELLNNKKMAKSINKKSRELRVTRCKKTFTPINKNNSRTMNLNDKQKSTLGRAQKVLGKMDRKLIRESLTIEGERATQDKQKQQGFKVSKMLTKSTQKVKKPRSKEGRSAKRSLEHKIQKQK